MKLSELTLLIIFIGALVAIGVLLPFYLTYQAILYTGFFSVESLSLIIITTFASYNLISFLKENWKKA